MSSGIRLEGIWKAVLASLSPGRLAPHPRARQSFEGSDLLKDVTWDVKKGERVGLVGAPASSLSVTCCSLDTRPGWNGSGKTTQLRIISGLLEPDRGEVLRAKQGMHVAFLSQEFDVKASRTVREELMTAFGSAAETVQRLEAVQAELERGGGENMERMAELLDQLGELQKAADRAKVGSLAGKIDKMMPTLGFDPLSDNHRLVNSFSGGWQMRLGLGKILLQEPDLLLLDEPTKCVPANRMLGRSHPACAATWMWRRLSGWRAT